ncbi:MAG: hypothetical protein H0Z34_10565 [Brevibacillus sp.]|nr:hypothetical protein [Brevibacillus sp.]
MNDEVMELIQRDLDGDLSAREKQQLHLLLRQDPDLQLVYSRLKRVSAQLAELPRISPPFSLVDAILPQITADDPSSPGTVQPERKPEDVHLQPKQIEAVASVHHRRSYGVWLAKAGTGVMAASLLFGLFWLSNGWGQWDRNQESGAGPQPRIVSQGQVNAAGPESGESENTETAAPKMPEPTVAEDNTDASGQKQQMETSPESKPEQSQSTPAQPAHGEPTGKGTPDRHQSASQRPEDGKSQASASKTGKASAAASDEYRQNNRGAVRQGAFGVLKERETDEEKHESPLRRNPAAGNQDKQAQKRAEKDKKEEEKQTKKQEKDDQKPGTWQKQTGKGGESDSRKQDDERDEDRDDDDEDEKRPKVNLHIEIDVEKLFRTVGGKD